jgi:transcriptional regulator with XRE-family HTH domain
VSGGPAERPGMTEEEFLADVGRRVRVLRAARDLSQRQLADAAGIHRTVVGRVERGRLNFGVDTLRRLAAALGTDTYALIPRLSPHGSTERPVTDALGPWLPDDLVHALDDAPAACVETFLGEMERHAGEDIEPERLWAWWRRIRHRHDEVGQCEEARKIMPGEVPLKVTVHGGQVNTPRPAGRRP